MELLVAADSLFLKTPDGRYWCKTIYGYDFWLRYLAVFDKVAVVSRTKMASYNEIEGYLRVDGPNLRIIELPAMRGMRQYLTNFLSFRIAAKEAVKNSHCALIRLPSVTASMVLKFYKQLGKPYALEVVADPNDAYKSNKIAQVLYTNSLKKSVVEANGVSYVTKEYLQNRYPSYARENGESVEYFESYFSTINLPSSYFTSARNYHIDGVKQQLTIIHTANSINNDMKGHTTVIKILKRLRESGYNVRAVFIGDGDKRSYYEQLAKKMGVGEFVTFTGLLSSASEVREELLKGDLFVFPTKAEGLPRAVIEAMAVGLPCLSTPVNGIPELLSEEYMFDPLDVDGFTRKIIELINSPKELNKMSNENVTKAREYVVDELEIRRREFYTKLKKLAEK